MKESEVTRSIIRGFMKDFDEHAQSDVIVVGAGPSGVTAAMLLAKEGLKTLIIEKDTEPGGGMWQGGMLFPKMVIESPADAFIQSLGVKMYRDEAGFSVADSYAVAAKLLSTAFDNGAKMLNSCVVDDVIFRDDGLKGVVINWTAVSHRSMDCVDPLALEAKMIIDATGHHADVARVVKEKMGASMEFVGHERSMWVDKAEAAVVEYTREIFPGLIVTGMAAASVFGLPRMGPVYGSMILGGIKAARLTLEKLNGGRFKNQLSSDVLEAIA